MEFVKSASPAELAAAGAALAVAGIALNYLSKPKPKYSLPPGPKPKPILGNLLDLPTVNESEVYARMGQTYGTQRGVSAWEPFTHRISILSIGDIIYLEALGQRIMVINSPEVANDLLERRSAIYSDRASTVMVHEL